VCQKQGKESVVTLTRGMRSGSIVTDNREEESEIGEIQVAPALQTIVQFQQIHLLQEAMDGCNNNIKQSKRL
jgi:hypothetical protein